MSCEVSEPACRHALPPSANPPARHVARPSKTRFRLAGLGLAFLPALLALACYYAPLARNGASPWDLHGDGRFYAYQLARAHEAGGRWWQLGEDPWVGQPYPSVAAKHPGVYEGLDVLLLSSLTGGWLSAPANLHLMVLVVLSFNGWVAGWMTYRLTGRLFWAAMAMALITVNVSTAYRFNTQLHLIKYGWVLIAAWAMWRCLELPSPRRGAWLGLAVALVLQSSFYFAFLSGLALAGWWLVTLAAGRLTRRHWQAAGFAALTASTAGAVFTAPVWLTARQALLADEQYFHRLRIETWIYGSQLWHYCVTPTTSYSHRFLQALGANQWTFLETWHYPGLTVLLALAVYAVARLRGWRIVVAQPRCLHFLLGLMALLIVLSLAGGPSAALFDLFPGFRCYGRAGCLAMALASVATPVIWHSVTSLLRPGWRAVASLALVTLLGCESYRLARWFNQGPDEQHPAWARWLAEQAPGVRAAVFIRYPEGWEAMWHWDALNQRMLHRQATLNGGEFALLNADLKQLGCSFWQINADGLRFVVSLGYETLVFHQEYLRENAWIEKLDWLDYVATAGEWRVYRANAQTQRFPTVTLGELMARQDGDAPLRLPAGALITDSFELAEPVVVGASLPVRLMWATAEGKRVGKAVPALFQHLLTPHWPAYHVQAPMQGGSYQLLFLDADDHALGVKAYQVDTALQTARQALGERALSVNAVDLDGTERIGPVHLRIENTTPFYIESHRFDPQQKGRSRFHVGLSTPGPYELHLTIQETASGGPKPAPLTVPLPRDLPPNGHLELVLPPAGPGGATEPTSAQMLGDFHQARFEVVPTGQADIRLERVEK
ncbi:MAG TPA: hypothetical protein VGX78_02590 [Pirellulales bacterium]|nr:hypothetical protein [Pirellulales bacterium]